jgi:hypothetical protein
MAREQNHAKFVCLITNRHLPYSYVPGRECAYFLFMSAVVGFDSVLKPLTDEFRFSQAVLCRI